MLFTLIISDVNVVAFILSSCILESQLLQHVTVYHIPGIRQEVYHNNPNIGRIQTASVKFEISKMIGSRLCWETKCTITRLTVCVQVQKAVKKSARREQLLREEMEQRRLKTVLELQFLLDQLGDDSIRQELKRPDATGSPLLTEADLTSLDEFYKLVGPDRNYDVRYESVISSACNICVCKFLFTFY